jgi:nuclear migration protein JNM1
VHTHIPWHNSAFSTSPEPSPPSIKTPQNVRCTQILRPSRHRTPRTSPLPAPTNPPPQDDAAPDVYQTPSLIDDASTVPGTTTTATTARSASPTSSGPDDGDDGDAGIVRRHLATGDARSRFRGARVAAEGVDFADRLRSRSYWTYSSGPRRRRRDGGEGHDDGDGEDEDDEDEDVEARVARLRKEVEEVRALCERRDAHEQAARGGDGGPLLKSVDGISDALDKVYERRHGGARGAQRELVRSLRAMEGEPPARRTAGERDGDAPAVQSTATGAQAEAASHALELAAAFDARLAALEGALGLAAAGGGGGGAESVASPSSLDAAASRPVLPTLANLERKLALATGQPGALDAAQAKVRALLKDAERLQRLRAEELQHEGSAPSAPSGSAEKEGLSASEQSKIAALYGLLPTVEALAPTLPLVLERLRTLRLLHAAAADASAALEDVEKRQEEQREELGTWREALEKVEAGLRDGQGALLENMEKMGGWVREVEARMERLA